LYYGGPTVSDLNGFVLGFYKRQAACFKTYIGNRAQQHDERNQADRSGYFGSQSQVSKSIPHLPCLLCAKLVIQLNKDIGIP
jgi:hypothetical protein